MSTGQYHRRHRSVNPDTIHKHGSEGSDAVNRSCEADSPSTACIYMLPYRYRNPLYSNQREMREFEMPINSIQEPGSKTATISSSPVNLQTLDPFLELSSNRTGQAAPYARRRLENAKWIECDVKPIQSMDVIMAGLTYCETTVRKGSFENITQELYERKLMDAIKRDSSKCSKSKYEEYYRQRQGENNHLISEANKPQYISDTKPDKRGISGASCRIPSLKRTARRQSNVKISLYDTKAEKLQEGNTYTKYVAAQKEFLSVFGYEEKFEPSVFDPPIDQRNRDIANRDDAADGVMWMGQSDDMDYICKMTLLCSELRFNLGGPYNAYKRLKGCRFFSQEIQRQSSNRAKILRYVDQDDINDYDETYLKQKEVERRIREAYPPYPEHESLAVWGEVLVTNIWADLSCKGVSVQLYLCMNESTESSYSPQSFRLKPKHVFMSGANFSVFICPKTSNLVFIERKGSPTLPTNNSMYDENVSRKNYLNRRFIYRRVSNAGNNGNTIEDNLNVKILRKCLSGGCSRGDHGGREASHNLITCARMLGYNAYRFPLEQLESVDRNPRSIRYALKGLPYECDAEESESFSQNNYQENIKFDTLIDYMASVSPTKMPFLKESHSDMKYYSTRCSILHFRSDSSFIGSYCFCLISMAAIMDELMEIFVLIHMQCHLTGGNLRSKMGAGLQELVSM